MTWTRRLVLALLLVSLCASCGGGSAVRRPTARLVIQAMHATWPGGRPVESGGLHYPTDIYVVDINGRHLRNLTHDAATNYFIAWLPASQRILYESEPSDAMRSRHVGIYSSKLDGSDVRQLASGTAEMLPLLSPDRNHILFERGRWLCLMTSDGRGKRRLVQTSFGTYGPLGSGPYDAAWSADGKKIVFVRGWSKTHGGYGDSLSQRAAIYVINADGSGLRTITRARAKVEAMNPMWTPDGRRIVFTEHDYSHPVIRDRTYLIDADGMHKTRLPQLDGGSWFGLPDGRVGYCCSATGYAAIEPDGKHKPEALPTRFRLGNQFVFNGPVERIEEWPLSPDGNWIARWTVNWKAGRARYGIWIQHPDGTERHLVTRKICCFFNSWDIAWAG